MTSDNSEPKAFLFQENTNLNEQNKYLVKRLADAIYESGGSIIDRNVADAVAIVKVDEWLEGCKVHPSLARKGIAWYGQEFAHAIIRVRIDALCGGSNGSNTDTGHEEERTQNILTAIREELAEETVMKIFKLSAEQYAHYAALLNQEMFANSERKEGNQSWKKE